MPYDTAFYHGQAPASEQSAREVLPLIINPVQPKSVVDIGCGVGTWLKACSELGVSDTVGVDGDYVNTSELLIPESSFVAHDLTQPLRMGRTFDLALSLEVGEHLPEGAASTLVATLVGLAPCVVFSAAIPGQGGTLHINEQWPDYWMAHFARHDFMPIDLLRPQVWTNPRVSPWYAQNLLVFVQKSHPLEATLSLLAREAQTIRPPALVHPQIFATSVSRANQSLPQLVYWRARRGLPESLKAPLRSISRRM